MADANIQYLYSPIHNRNELAILLISYFISSYVSEMDIHN